MLAPGLTAATLALATTALHLRDPHDSGTWGYCPTALLGFACPGCGGLRAVNDLTNGDVGAALSSNLVVTVAVPIAVVLLALWGWDSWRGRTRTVEWSRLRPYVVGFVTLLAVFTVTRNTGPGSWLAP